MSKKYLPTSLSKKDRIKQKKMLLKSKKLYRKGKYFTRSKLKSFKSKKSSWVVKASKLYNVKVLNPNKILSKKTGCTVKGLKDIIKKGQGAYYSSGSRPNQTAHSWGIARLGSAITGGPASKVDYHIIEKECKKNSKPLHLANKFMKGGKLVKPVTKQKKIYFSDYPEFTPNLTPKEIFQLGSFGGTYWRPIYSGITKKNYKYMHKKYPADWWKGLSPNQLTSSVCDITLNKYKVKVGTSLKLWEKKGWINKEHPYGWVQWYCDFYRGKRSSDDKRQIDRWNKFAGKKGRFRLWLITLIKKKNTTFDDYSVSPKIRQSLQHWGYVLTQHDFNK
jgi:hypothetical protein